MAHQPTPLKMSCLPGWGSDRRQFDPVAELLETAHGSAFDSLTVAFIEVVAAQVFDRLSAG